IRSSRERNAATTHPRRCRSSRTMGEFYRMTRKRLRRQVVEFVDVRGFDDPQDATVVINIAFIDTLIATLLQLVHGVIRHNDTESAENGGTAAQKESHLRSNRPTRTLH